MSLEEESELERSAREEFEHSQEVQPIVVYIIFEKPPIAPLNWVMVPEIVYPGKPPVRGEPQLAKSLEEARKFVPPGCERFDREPDDPPYIAEHWI